MFRCHDSWTAVGVTRGCARCPSGQLETLSGLLPSAKLFDLNLWLLLKARCFARSPGASAQGELAGVPSDSSGVGFALLAEDGFGYGGVRVGDNVLSGETDLTRRAIRAREWSRQHPFVTRRQVSCCLWAERSPCGLRAEGCGRSASRARVLARACARALQLLVVAEQAVIL